MEYASAASELMASDQTDLTLDDLMDDDCDALFVTSEDDEPS